jgi:hypothetical protein
LTRFLSRLTPERSRVTICLALAVSCLLLDLTEPAGAFAQPGAGSATPTLPKLPQILAFDLPPGGDAAKIRGFVIGYFQGDAIEPRWVLDVARELARFDEDGSVRILLPLTDLPAGTYAARVKIRTESTVSDWSAPGPPFFLPELPRRPAPRPARSEPAAPKPPRALKLAPAIADAVRPLLPRDVDLADATRGFRKPVHFVSAVFAARNLGIALPDLKAKLFATPGEMRALDSALAELRPDRDANKEARKALEQARRLVRDANRTRRTPGPSHDDLQGNRDLIDLDGCLTTAFCLARSTRSTSRISLLDG